jgi:hypothetical protein
MNNHAHPIFAKLLNTFGGAAYNAVDLSYPKCQITVPSIEVTIHPEHLDARDVYFDKTGFITDEQVQRAYTILAERHSDELDAIAMAIVKGELV